MTETELQQARREKWRLDGRAIRTMEEAREWIESVGFCLMFPISPNQAKAGLAETGAPSAVMLPTFIGAWVGSEERLPTARQAFADARAAQAQELMVRLLRSRAAYEGRVFGESNFLVAAPVFPYFYGLVGDRHPKEERQRPGRAERYSPLATDAFKIIQRQGPISKRKLLEALGGEPSGAALDRALGELWSKLKITRVDYSPREGASWDALHRWAPQAVKQGASMSVPEALSALISKYLDCVVGAEAKEVEEFFAPLVPRSKVRDAVNALLAARELTLVRVGKQTILQVTPPRAAGERRRIG